MTEVFPSLFVGHQGDFEYQVDGREGWAVVHACKEPYHRELLGYTTRGAPKGPEYLAAVRGDRLFLNMVDVKDPAFVHVELIERALSFIHEKLMGGKKVLVHCNQGESRGPAIAFLYLLRNTEVLPKVSPDQARKRFCQIYSQFLPSRGIWGFIQQHWDGYTS